jgi:hypothetical protein
VYSRYPNNIRGVFEKTAKIREQKLSANAQRTEHGSPCRLEVMQMRPNLTTKSPPFAAKPYERRTKVANTGHFETVSEILQLIFALCSATRASFAVRLKRQMGFEHIETFCQRQLAL